MFYGVDNRPFPVPVQPDRVHRSAGTPLFSPYDLFIFAVVDGGLVGIGLLFTRTAIGLRMRAAAFAPETVPAARRQRVAGCSRSAGRWPRRSARWPAC